MRVKARYTFEAYIPDTEIAVRIPEGTTGILLTELRGGVVTVQFDVPSLGPLRADRDALLISDTPEAIVESMRNLLGDKTLTTPMLQKETDELLIRALRYLASDGNREMIEELIELHSKVPRPYRGRI